MRIFKPSPRYLTRLRVERSLWAVIILGLGIVSAGVVSLVFAYSRQATLILQIVILADFIWYLPAVGLTRAFYEARSYCLSDDEIIIVSGWFTKSICRIPLSNVIAFEARWDWLDRWLEIGTIAVQTVTGEKGKGLRVYLTGLADVETVTQLATQRLLRLKDQRLAEKASILSNQEHRMMSFRHQI